MDSPTPQKPNHLEPSPLGTKEYWDSLYTTELTNHAADPTDIGTCWFDDSSAESKIASFLSNSSSALSISRPNTSFLDLGTGNGHLLFRLREEGWEGEMLGVDYSELSVEFARRIAKEKRGEGEAEVRFARWDIMTEDPAGILREEKGWDVVLDKGTFDAISLSEEKDALGRRICEGYCEKVLPLIKPGGCFLVTSCNWTEDELLGWFEGKKEGQQGWFEVVERVKYRSFSFGGVKGQSVSSICFRKCEDLP